MTELQASRKRRKLSLSGKTIKRLIIGVLIVGLATTTVLLYRENQSIKQNPAKQQEIQQKAADKEVDRLVEKISKLISLPNDEKPTVAKVEKKEELKDQPFFADAEVGDRILIYAKARKAIIYRESDNRIINVGPIAITGQSQTPQVSIIGNEADTKGLESKIQSLIGKITFTRVRDSKSDQTGVFVILTNDTAENRKTADEVAKALGVEVTTSLPNGESSDNLSPIVVYVKN